MRTLATIGMLPFRRLQMSGVEELCYHADLHAKEVDVGACWANGVRNGADARRATNLGHCKQVAW